MQYQVQEHPSGVYGHFETFPQALWYAHWCTSRGQQHTMHIYEYNRMTRVKRHVFTSVREAGVLPQPMEVEAEQQPMDLGEP